MAKDLKISLLLDFYGNVLTDKQREMIEFYYNDDLSLSEIAENEGITRQGVRDAIKRGEMQLLEMEEHLGFAVRFGKLQAGLNEIARFAQEISAVNARSGAVRIIEALAGEISNKAEQLGDTFLS